MLVLYGAAAKNGAEPNARPADSPQYFMLLKSKVCWDVGAHIKGPWG